MRAWLQVLGFGIVAWGNVYRLFPSHKLAFGLTPFLVAYTLTQLVGHNTWEAICKFTVSCSQAPGLKKQVHARHC